MTEESMSNLISNILVGVDFSEGSAQALRYAAQLAQQSGARLHVLYVHGAAVALSEDTFAFGFDVADYVSRLKQAGEHRRDALARFVDKEVEKAFGGQVQVCQHLREGEVRSEILNAIEEIRPDLVIMGRRGRGALARIMLGSVSTFLCQHSPIPTLVIPTQGERCR
jgi:nucleotide-binding universal stress UspA family protein